MPRTCNKSYCRLKCLISQFNRCGYVERKARILWLMSFYVYCNWRLQSIVCGVSLSAKSGTIGKYMFALEDRCAWVESLAPFRPSNIGQMACSGIMVQVYFAYCVHCSLMNDFTLTELPWKSQMPITSIKRGYVGHFSLLSPSRFYCCLFSIGVFGDGDNRNRWIQCTCVLAGSCFVCCQLSTCSNPLQPIHLSDDKDGISGILFWNLERGCLHVLQIDMPPSALSLWMHTG